MRSRKKVRVRTLKNVLKKKVIAKRKAAAKVQRQKSDAKTKRQILRRNIKVIKKAAKTATRKRIAPKSGVHVVAKERHHKKRNDVSLKVLSPEVVESLKKDKFFSQYVNEKIGNRADEVILSLAAPVTDEALAEKLEMKINDARRVLNMLNTNGVARYIVNKNSKGWLTFKWYIDENNLKKMRGEMAIKTTMNNTDTALPENCNDYYVCGKCYTKTKHVYPFEVGYEMNFKCDSCGSYFERKSKEDIEKLIF